MDGPSPDREPSPRLALPSCQHPLQSVLPVWVPTLFTRCLPQHRAWAREQCLVSRMGIKPKYPRPLLLQGSFSIEAEMSKVGYTLRFLNLV